ncbi:uncharacterized protein PRCAT00004226001 [Priceomyces carsonii]|uniref:uncharacterized protein n=1 Tax=Priceomyces carsonii TaxID=28549 RepID=UPI002ED78E19|nr:unnamed protein product [Priceomyces carsonii]
MSLIIPNRHDYEDATIGRERIPIYEKKIEKLEEEIDPTTGEPSYPWRFEALSGFFKQADPKTEDLKFNYINQDFGATKPWHEIIDEIQKLNETANENECYKLLFLARHGQGYHNVIVSKYGHHAWYSKWHALGTDGDIVYAPDPDLTELGVNQAKENHAAWKEQLAKGAPKSSKFYVSPLKRSCDTLRYTWEGLAPETFHPVIVEDLREIIGFHLCNKRSTKTQILERFGKYGYTTEPGFTEKDELYGDTEELFEDHCIRVNKFLQRLFNNNYDEKSGKTNPTLDQIISTTSHGGTIKCFLAVTGHRAFTVSTGGMIPIVVRGVRTKSSKI